MDDGEVDVVVRKMVFWLILLMFFSVSVAAEDMQKIIIVGMDIDYPPLSFVNETVPVGFDVDIVKELNQYSPQKMKVALDTWTTVMSNLDSGKFDAISGILCTEERAKVYDFTVPYNIEPAVVFISKQANVNTLQELYNKKMANLKGDSLPTTIILNDGKHMEIQEFNTFSEVFLSLETGQNDFAIAPYSVGMEMIKRYNYKNVKAMGPTLSTYQYRMAVKKGNAEVLTNLNMAISKMSANGSLDTNREKWIKYKNESVSSSDVIKYVLYICVPFIIGILLLSVYILKREVVKKTMLLQEKNEALTKLAMLDPATGLFNRRKFYELAGLEFEKAKRTGSIFGLVMVDLDWFKSINDTYGHDVGDQVILHFAYQCKANFRTYDIACRYGGEEFIVLLPATNEEMVMKMADRVRRMINATEIPIHDGRTVIYTVSIGVTAFRMTDESVDEMIKRADTALYKAKEQGRNRIVRSI